MKPRHVFFLLVLAFSIGCGPPAFAAKPKPSSPPSTSSAAIAVIDAIANSLRLHPDQVVNVVVGGIDAGSGGINVSPHLTDTHGNFTGVNNSPTIDAGTVCKRDKSASARQSAETIQVLKEIRAAIEKNDAAQAEQLLPRLKEKSIDVVFEVVSAIVLKLLKVG